MKKLPMVTAVAGALTLAVTLGLALRANGAAPTPLWAPATKGIAATANADASRAAAEILRKGGNAVDGAVAAALALGVVNADSSGLGGGGFALVWSAKDKKARVIVPEDQLSIAIGKGGQNVRLASTLTGYELDIAADQATPAPAKAEPPKEATGKPAPAPKLKKKSELENSLLEAIEEHGE